ncbi:carbon starvation CstA family protein [Brachybacterium saurashtrense]|uniref:Carbon starvation protein A n=1 Tax=Brachybacterium saurashtrense TaxID=556288 RepID=A0A345YT42_9MICO|nr:carbon starvation protein A [Brachybacterium saurashtrense]AXK47094.1 carbon starvation protein A [Brachybacterium saurashtrense]RRR21559.1 carbon starvation protein A [Brachybacterium saurashtrense]
MNSLILAGIGVAMMIAGYLLYSRFLGRRVYRLSASFRTPAHELQDGVDFVPTNKFILWGHHFTSVAGAAPIVGPAIAVIWGWLPAFLWVTLGTVFFAGMHDLGALWASVRHRGQSIGTLSARYIGARGSRLFLVVIFLLLLMVNAAFAVVIAGLLVSTPTAVLPTWGALVVAVLIGQAIYRLKWSLPVVSMIGVAALYGLILLGDRFPVVLPETVLGLSATSFWIVVLFLYAAVASTLPVWVLLQPRDYINGLQLFIGLGLLYGSVLLFGPSIVAPAVNANVPEGTPGLMPLLFVTIACGAISGFHGIVSSGTSAKQLDKETDARFVGYFGAVGEGLLALGAIIATTAGFRTLADWEEVYSAFGQGGVGAFVDGGGAILNAGLGLPTSLSSTILATMAVLFAATTMDTGVRLQRFVVQEIGDLVGVKLGTVVATAIVLVVCLGLTFSAGADGSGGMLIWPLFGTTNQILAGLTLSILAVMLVRRRRPVLPALVPLVFVLFVSVYALLIQLGGFYRDGNWLLLVLDVIILVAALWVIVEAAVALRRARTAEPDLDEDEPAQVGTGGGGRE